MSVELDALWFSLAADPSVRMGFPLVESYQPAPTIPGDERQGPSGRIRAFSNGPRTWSFGLNLPDLTEAQVEFLTDNLGELMCLRDHKGRKVFGRFRTAPFEESILTTDWVNTQITFVEVSFSEAV